MDNVQKHSICTNVPSSQTFRSYLCAQDAHHLCQWKGANIVFSQRKQNKFLVIWSTTCINNLLQKILYIMYFHSIYLGIDRCKVRGSWWPFHWSPSSSPMLREPFIQPFSNCMALTCIACGPRLVAHSVGLCVQWECNYGDFGSHHLCVENRIITF
jgi:hypothetical protein